MSNGDGEIEEEEEMARAREESLRESSVKQNSRAMTLVRTSSLGAQKQLDGTCYAYASARVITKFIKNTIPHFFDISRVKDDLELDPSLLGRISLGIVRDAFDRMKREKRFEGKAEAYNYMCVFYFTYFRIVGMFGKNGGFPEKIFETFTNDPITFFFLRTAGLTMSSQIIISNVVDKNAKNIASRFIERCNHNPEWNEVRYDFSEDTESDNWVTNLPEQVKQVLRANCYVCLTFYLPNSQYTILMDLARHYPEYAHCMTSNSAYDKIVTGHAVVITNYDEDAKTATIINSWGQEWGNKGQVLIRPNQYRYFVMDKRCKKAGVNYNMVFSFLIPARPVKPWYNHINLFGSCAEGDEGCLVGRGGKKTRKRKSQRKFRRKSNKR
jgi:hypothetical protein